EGWRGRGRCGSGVAGSGVEAVGNAAAVDVEDFQDFTDIGEVEVPVERPVDDVEVFLPRLQPVQNTVQKGGLVLHRVVTLEQPEITTIQLKPDFLPLQVLAPACPQVAVPVIFDPMEKSRLAQIAPRLLAQDPFMTLGFLATFLIKAVFDKDVGIHVATSASSHPWLTQPR